MIDMVDQIIIEHDGDEVEEMKIMITCWLMRTGI